VTTLQENMKFTVHATDGAARSGTLSLAHGEVETPVFMPVGTYGAVKAVSPAELAENGTRIVLGNTFHLWLRRAGGHRRARRAAPVHGLERPDAHRLRRLTRCSASAICARSARKACASLLP